MTVMLFMKSNTSYLGGSYLTKSVSKMVRQTEMVVDEFQFLEITTALLLLSRLTSTTGGKNSLMGSAGHRRQ